MRHDDHELKAYAEHGLRSAEDWATLGRQIEPGTIPRAVTAHRGKPMDLFARDQSKRAEARVRLPKAPKTVPTTTAAAAAQAE